MDPSDDMLYALSCVVGSADLEVVREALELGPRAQTVPIEDVLRQHDMALGALPTTRVRDFNDRRPATHGDGF
eukprot:CAMPEP_0176053652 /NCGR_PEP_ID=MMETSP0120_2-20121206/26689_1 /TAXON_ID=160619 /ORGANISM="Kryptoperidinium foliaceum, Strain CCMP 1326" /LENGTH=72 /DNA_ID=CAMNT_0017387111 /DNA_START=361 /DNA_END=578 /DNA_ORIENTATION=-